MVRPLSLVSEAAEPAAAADPAAATGPEPRSGFGPSSETHIGAWDADLPTGRATWSEGCFRALGLPPNPAGEASTDLWVSRLHPEDRAAVLAIFERARAERGIYHAEYRILNPDTGELSWLADFGRFFYDAEGQAIRATGLFVNVTEPRHAERVLRESEERLRESERQMRSLADNCPDALARFDRDLRCVFISAAVAPMTGHPPEYFLGHTLREVDLPSSLCDLWDESLSKVFATAEPVSIEFDFESPAGPRNYKSRQVPELGPTGQVEHAFAITTDVTDRKRAEEELRQASLRKDEFLATLAHELRNPLAPILHALDLMKLDGPDGALFEQAQAMMERQLGQMVHLIDDLLDVSRITQGKLELRRQRIALTAAIESAVETSRPLIERHRQHLALSLPAEPVFLDADLTRLAQILLNLLNNASKYTPAGGRIDLTARVEGGEVVIAVQDTGSGIPADILPRIFDMFVQGQRGPHGGLGIGLTLVQRLTEMHGGTIEARSDGPGQGSEFVVRLPITEG